MTGALVGRHSELQQLVEAFKASRAGGAVTVVIRGEPGIGKSRLLTEALAQAELLGHDVLHGRLDELDRYLPYAAIRAAVWPALAAEHDPELVDAAETVQEGLTALLAGGTERDAVPVHRLFEGLERLLREWCDRRPVVLAIDDLHAADSDTLTLVALLVRHLQTAPIAFVATMRSHPPDVSVELQSAVEQLARDSLASVIELGPLDRDEVRAVARAVVSATPDERLVGALFEAAKGNPFYVEEGVRSLQASGALVVDHDECRLADEAAPPTLSGRSTLVYRLFNLGPAARRDHRARRADRRRFVRHPGERQGAAARRGVRVRPSDPPGDPLRGPRPGRATPRARAHRRAAARRSGGGPARRAAGPGDAPRGVGRAGRQRRRRGARRGGPGRVVVGTGFGRG